MNLGLVHDYMAASAERRKLKNIINPYVTEPVVSGEFVEAN